VLGWKDLDEGVSRAVLLDDLDDEVTLVPLGLGVLKLGSGVRLAVEPAEARLDLDDRLLIARPEAADEVDVLQGLRRVELHRAGSGVRSHRA
jgi:hypothetical protein